jgi:hypothetical protein
MTNRVRDGDDEQQRSARARIGQATGVPNRGTRDPVVLGCLPPPLLPGVL